MDIYVGNLSRDVKDGDLREAFVAYGAVASARVIMDKYTGESRGYGFVEMADEEGRAAIAGLNGAVLKGLALRVNEAHSRREGRGGGGGGGGTPGGGSRQRW